MFLETYEMASSATKPPEGKTPNGDIAQMRLCGNSCQ